MKSLRDYIAETETWIDDPAQGDEFDIELAPDSLLETHVVDVTEDGIIIEADEGAMALLEQHGLLGERMGTYGAVGYGGMGQTFFEKDQEIEEHGGGIGPRQHWQSMMEEPVETGTALSVPQLATISDEALDKAYGYGRSTPGNTFGWQANLMSAAYAKKLIDAGVTDIEKISDAIHKGWNVTAQKFVQNPDQFDDTEKLRQAGKLDAKLQQRAKLMKINYAQLDNDEQEKDRVVARALLQAIKGPQGLAERSDEYQGEIDTSNLVLKSLMYKSGGRYSDGYYDGKVYDNQGQYIGDLGFIPGGTQGQIDGYTGSYSWPHRVTLYVKNPKDPQLQSYWEKMGKDKFGYGKFPLEYKISNLNDPLAKQAIDLYTKANKGVAEGDYPDGSSIRLPSVDEYKKLFQQAVLAVKNAKTSQEYEAASERAGQIKDFLASKGVQVGSILGKQGVSEGAMKKLDIRIQDYKTMTPQQFQSAYGMKKADWAMKHGDLLQKHGLQTDWTGKSGFDFVREASRILELAGVADHKYDREDDVYHEDQSAAIVAKKEMDMDAALDLGMKEEREDVDCYEEDEVDEAKYQGREVPLGKPMKGDVKKSKVYVRGPKGNVVKVNFGDKSMRIKKSNPKRRKSFRARHNCANPGPRHKARYWSCRAW